MRIVVCAFPGWRDYSFSIAAGHHGEIDVNGSVQVLLTHFDRKFVVNAIVDDVREQVARMTATHRASASAIVLLNQIIDDFFAVNSLMSEVHIHSL